MAVIRVNKTKNYTVMSNYHLKDKRLSLKAKGLLSVMLSLTDEWNYSIAGLVAISKENETSIKTAIKELKSNGYVIVTKKMPNETESGRYEYEYDIYEQPLTKQETEKQGIESLGVESLGVGSLEVENHPLYKDTKELNTKELNTNNKKTKNKTAVNAILVEYSNGNAEILDLLNEWLKVRKCKRAPQTERAIQMNIDKLDSLAEQSGMSVVDYLKEIICRGWAAFYAINNYSNNNGQASKPASSQYDGLDEYFISQMHQKPAESGIDYNAEDAPF